MAGHATHRPRTDYDAGMTTRLTIGQAARDSGCTPPTIRYYEEIGLLPDAPRTEAGQRRYDASALRRLGFIRRCRDFGFSIDQVRELVDLVDHPDRPCDEVRAVAQAHLQRLRSRIDEIRALEARLNAFVQGCAASCAGGPTVDCKEPVASTWLTAPRSLRFPHRIPLIRSWRMLIA